MSPLYCPQADDDDEYEPDTEGAILLFCLTFCFTFYSSSFAHLLLDFLAVDTLEGAGIDLPEISWDELMTHNKVDDIWVSIVSSRAIAFPLFRHDVRTL